MKAGKLAGLGFAAVLFSVGSPAARAQRGQCEEQYKKSQSHPYTSGLRWSFGDKKACEDVAKEPSAASYARALSSCMPSCWKPERPPGPPKEVTVCGYDKFRIRQPRIGKRWGKMDGNHIVGDVTVLDKCKFPKPKAKFRKMLAQAKKAFPGWRRGNVIVVEPQDDWQLERHALTGRILSRYIHVRIYAKDYKVKPRCGGRDPKAVCAWSRSKTAMDADEAVERVKRAQSAKASGFTVGCQVEAWGAVKAIRTARARRTKLKGSKEWVEGLKYVITGVGTMDEAKLFAWFDVQEKTATALFHGCGGKKPLPFRAGQDDD